MCELVSWRPLLLLTASDYNAIGDVGREALEEAAKEKGTEI